MAGLGIPTAEVGAIAPRCRGIVGAVYRPVSRVVRAHAAEAAGSATGACCACMAAAASANGDHRDRLPAGCSRTGQQAPGERLTAFTRHRGLPASAIGLRALISASDATSGPGTPANAIPDEFLIAHPKALLAGLRILNSVKGLVVQSNCMQVLQDYLSPTQAGARLGVCGATVLR